MSEKCEATTSSTTTDAPSTSSPAGSPARTSRARTTRDGVSKDRGPASGSSSAGSSRKRARSELSWRTSVDSLGGVWTSWPPVCTTSGTPSSSLASEPPTWAPRTGETGSSSSGSWPTPTAGDARSSGSRNTPGSAAHPGTSLTDAVREDGGTGRLPSSARAGEPTSLWPTPASADSHNGGLGQKREGGASLPAAVGAPLNPEWVEALMGFPQGYTALDLEGSGRLRAELRSARGKLRARAV